MKPVAGFRAELSGCDLAGLIQLTCARRERQVVRISSYGEEGYLYSAAGRIVHATLGALVGEAAVLCMLGWESGDFVMCALPFPETATVQRSTEGLLALASQRAVDSELDAVLEAVSVDVEHDDSSERQLRDSASTRSDLRPARPSVPPPPPRTSVPPSERHSVPPPRSASLPPPALMPAERISSTPPRPPAARREALRDPDPATVASVRVDAHGALLYANGGADHLAQLVAYIAHVVGLLQADFALDPFQALHAELSDLRVLVYQEGGDVVGVLMKPGPAAQELRQRLGV